MRPLASTSSRVFCFIWHGIAVSVVTGRLPERRTARSGRPSSNWRNPSMNCPRTSDRARLGEHLYRIATGEVVADHPKASDGFDPRRIRGRWFRRKQVEDEFDGLWNAQTRFHSLSGEQHEQLRDRLHHAIFDQRRLKSRKHLIGFCECIPRKRTLQRSDWRAIQFAILKDVCNLYVLDKDEQRIDLTKKDRQKCMMCRVLNRELSFDHMRDRLIYALGRFILRPRLKEREKRNKMERAKRARMRDQKMRTGRQLR